MSIFKLLYFILTLGIAASALPGAVPAAKPGEYCAGPATSKNISKTIRGKFQFCLDVDKDSKAKFTVKVLEAEYKKDNKWNTVHEGMPYTIAATLYYPSGDGRMNILAGQSQKYTELTTIRGGDLPGDLTAGTHEYTIRVIEEFPDTHDYPATVGGYFTFNIEAE